MEEPPHPDGARASRIGFVPHEEWQATHRDPTQASLALAHELAAEFGKAREPSRETHEVLLEPVHTGPLVGRRKRLVEARNIRQERRAKFDASQSLGAPRLPLCSRLSEYALDVRPGNGPLLASERPFECCVGLFELPTLGELELALIVRFGQMLGDDQSQGLRFTETAQTGEPAETLPELARHPEAQR